MSKCKPKRLSQILMLLLPVALLLGAAKLVGEPRQATAGDPEPNTQMIVYDLRVVRLDVSATVAPPAYSWAKDVTEGGITQLSQKEIEAEFPDYAVKRLICEQRVTSWGAEVQIEQRRNHPLMAPNRRTMGGENAQDTWTPTSLRLGTTASIDPLRGRYKIQVIDALWTPPADASNQTPPPPTMESSWAGSMPADHSGRTLVLHQRQDYTNPEGTPMRAEIYVLITSRRVDTRPKPESPRAGD